MKLKATAMCMMLTLAFTCYYNTKTLCGNITETTELEKVYVLN